MSRRDNAQARCTRCRVHKSLCFCAQIPRIETRTQLLLVIHYREERKPTNTGMLAAECLTNSVVMVRGKHHDPQASENVFPLDPSHQALLLFPSDQSQPISNYCGCSRPITLIVPDGNWRQASKVRSRVQALRDVPMVTLPGGMPTQYGLRYESQENGLATMEAIARALGVLEGPMIRGELERIFRLFVERTLWARGALNSSEVKGGLPPLAVRHDPLSGTR